MEEQDGVLRVKDLSKLAEIETATSFRIMERKPDERVEEPVACALGEDSRAALRAMRKAFADVVIGNKSWGLPIIQWREGKGVVEVPAEQLEPLARRILEVNGEPLPEEETRALLAHVRA